MPRFVAALALMLSLSACGSPEDDDRASPVDEELEPAEMPGEDDDDEDDDDEDDDDDDEGESGVSSRTDGGRPPPTMRSDAGSTTTRPDASRADAQVANGDASVPVEPTDEGSPTHGKLEQPNYEVVFPKAKVNELTIEISPANWQTMLDDMTKHWGQRGGFGRPPTNPGQAGGNLGGFPDHDPVYAAVTVRFNGLTWKNVGLRFKGNSSLRQAWSSNNDRFPFRMDFDQFEDENELKNQRFYGFKTLSLSNNTGDPTHIREALYYDLSGEAELITPARGFYEIYLDRGEGAKSLGLYTVLEVVREHVIPRHFEDASGSLFKATNTASNLAANAKASLMKGFEAQSGIGRKKEEADWSKLSALHDALHATTRTSNASAWRAGLEQVFDVPTYLKWLALSTLFQHWDTYGRMPHNYYLYDDPQSKQLHWISWDHNFVLGASPGGGMGGFGFPGGSVPYDKSNAGTSWPLITFLYADANYRRTYDTALRDLLATAFEPTKAARLVDEYGTLLAPYATKSTSRESYTQALQALKSAINAQATAARRYLGVP